MSWLRRPLNLWLRLTERPALARARAETVNRSRRRFERSTRWFLWPPRGLRFDWLTLDGALPVRAMGIETSDDEYAPTLLYFHGGGYFIGSPRTVKNMVGRIVRRAGVQAILPDYRMAPEHPFPAALDDAVSAYQWAVGALEPSAPIIIGGDSAGGGLVLALLQEICRRGLRQPVLTFAMSPWTDLTNSGETLRSNDATEVVLPSERMDEVAAVYLDGADANDPRASPLFGDCTGAGPVLITASTTEILLDDARRMATALQEQGVPVTFSLSEGLPHVWQMFAGLLPEADASVDEIAAAIRVAIGR